MEVAVLKDKYYQYKLEYKEYVIIIKSGNFYTCLDSDAIVMNQIFNYKIVETTNQKKIGFPLNSINKVKVILEEKQVNYIIVEEEIIEKRKNKKNNYKKFLNKIEEYIKQIDKINEILRNNVNNSKIEKLLKKIEEDIWQIN